MIKCYASLAENANPSDINFETLGPQTLEKGEIKTYKFQISASRTAKPDFMNML